MRSFLPNDIKDQNRKIVFDVLLQEPELAKSEVTERTTMSMVTVGKIMDYFEEIGLIGQSGISRGGSGGLGRKRIVYQLNPNRCCTIGIQLIGGEMSAVLINLYHEILTSVRYEKLVSFSGNEFIPAVISITEKLRKYVSAGTVILGIGIGIDGAIHSRKGMIRIKTKEDREEDFDYLDIVDQLLQETGLPIFWENDVNASAAAEFSELNGSKKEIPGADYESLLHIVLGEGIGAGLILEGKLCRGHNAGVGELQYTCFEPSYRRKPSAVGWLEERIGLPYLERTFGYNVTEPDRMTENQRSGSIAYIGQYLGLAISNLVSFLDLSVVVLSGRVLEAYGEEIAEAVKKGVEQYTGWELEIRISLNPISTATGAAILSLEQETTRLLAGKEGINQNRC